MNGRRQQRKQTRAAVWPLPDSCGYNICEETHILMEVAPVFAITETIQLFKALSEPTRLRIVRLLAANAAEACVCELVDSLDEPQYHISRHLRELRDCGLLSVKRDGRWMYYRLSDNATVKDLARFVAALSSDPFAADQKGFEARMKLREAGRCRVGIQKEHLSDAPLSDAPAEAVAGVR